MPARWFRTRFRRVVEQVVAIACKMVPDQVLDQVPCSVQQWLARWFRARFRKVPEQAVAIACKMVPD